MDLAVQPEDRSEEVWLKGGDTHQCPVRNGRQEGKCIVSGAAGSEKISLHFDCRWLHGRLAELDLPQPARFQKQDCQNYKAGPLSGQLETGPRANGNLAEQL